MFILIEIHDVGTFLRITERTNGSFVDSVPNATSAEDEYITYVKSIVKINECKINRVYIGEHQRAKLIIHWDEWI